MPRRIPREEALRRVAALRAGAAGCPLCALAGVGPGTPRRVLARTPHAVAVLNAFPREWGHVLIVLTSHVTSFGELAPEAWLDACALAHRVAVAVERVVRPARCYVASLGSASEDLATSFPHLHLHVLPVVRAEDRPSQVFTWDAGVLEADEAEWAQLADALVGALR